VAMINSLKFISVFQKFSLKRIVLPVCIVLFTFVCCQIALAEADEEFLEYCNAETFNKEYDGTCWSCAIVETLMKSTTAAVTALSSPILDLSKLVLFLGAAIWLAMYFLKSVSSFATQDPAKILDGLFTFMFKWAFAFTIINMGIDSLVEEIVNPLLSIGMDIGTEFLKLSKV
jgi:hypothetical protein